MYGLLRRFLTRCPRQILFLCSLLLVLGLGLPSHYFWTSAAVAQDRSPAQLVQVGVNAYRAGDYADAIATWTLALETYPTDALAERALINANLARAYQHMGDTKAAIDAWGAAADAYEQNNQPTQFGRMQTEQAQVYISLGQHQRAAALLCGSEPAVLTQQAAEVTVNCAGGAYAIAQAAADWVGQAAALGSLAETYRLRGLYEQAQALLKSSLELVQTHHLKQYEAPIFNGLGNIYARLSEVVTRRAESAELLNVMDRQGSVAEKLREEAKDNQTMALGYFDKAIKAARQQQDRETELRSHLSVLSFIQLQANQDNNDATIASRQRLEQLINQLPNSRETAYAAIALAKSYQTTHHDFSCDKHLDSPLVQTWLEAGRDIAVQIKDDRAQSFALGELGHLEECRGNLDYAAQLTNQAQLAASNALESNDSLYLWEWQIGRIHWRQNQSEKALAAYAQAIATLERIRTDILTADRELQFDFRDTVEPVYRQYIELQLEAPSEIAATKQVVPVSNTRISEILKTVDSLRLAELQNFFGSDCVLVSSEGARARLLKGESQTVVISSIVLPNRTVLIANFPNGAAKIAGIEDSEALRQTANEFRRSLKRFRDLTAYDKSLAQQLYQQLIGEFEADLTAANINTLVFVHDGFLRNIPIAALHDGDQYLIQRYAVTTTPSLSLTASRADRRRGFRALAVGLSQETITESGREFPALNFVPSELESVSEQLPGSKTLLDGNFTLKQLKAALQEGRYPILHLATHGQFSTIPEDTFVVTGSSDSEASGELTFGQLENLIREAAPNADPIDLITLTACETATGDDRATLGLAGVAIRAGARSAIASLWKVNDETAAQLIDNFYQNLKNPSFSKAQALQTAQIAAIDAADEDKNPGYWAPLILVGNWQ